jgi:hypothetical protein
MFAERLDKALAGAVFRMIGYAEKATAPEAQTAVKQMQLLQRDGGLGFPLSQPPPMQPTSRPS